MSLLHDYLIPRFPTCIPYRSPCHLHHHQIPPHLHMSLLLATKSQNLKQTACYIPYLLAAANVSKETMQCECHKIPTPPASNSSAPRPPTGGGSSNSTSSGGSSSLNRLTGSSSGGSNSSVGLSSGSPGGASSGNPRGSFGGSPSGSSAGSSGGSSAGSLSGSSGGGQQRPHGQGSDSINPIGYASAPPLGPPPVGYVALASESQRNQLPLYTEGQQSGNTPPRQVGRGFARPGPMLSTLNNSTSNILPRLLNRLNSTSFPCDIINSTRSILSQDSTSLRNLTHQIFSNLLRTAPTINSTMLTRDSSNSNQKPSSPSSSISPFPSLPSSSPSSSPFSNTSANRNNSNPTSSSG